MFTYFICLYMFTYLIMFLHVHGNPREPTGTHGNPREPNKPGGGKYVYCMGNRFTTQLIYIYIINKRNKYMYTYIYIYIYTHSFCLFSFQIFIYACFIYTFWCLSVVLNHQYPRTCGNVATARMLVRGTKRLNERRWSFTDLLNIPGHKNGGTQYGQHGIW